MKHRIPKGLGKVEFRLKRVTAQRINFYVRCTGTPIPNDTREKGELVLYAIKKANKNFRVFTRYNVPFAWIKQRGHAYYVYANKKNKFVGKMSIWNNKVQIDIPGRSALRASMFRNPITNSKKNLRIVDGGTRVLSIYALIEDQFRLVSRCPFTCVQALAFGVAFMEH